MKAERMAMCMAEAGFPLRVSECNDRGVTFDLPAFHPAFASTEFWRASYRASVLTGFSWTETWCEPHYVAHKLEMPYATGTPACECYR